MPFKPADNPKCPKCSKSVYAAEERVAGGYKFHKSCFKCGLCSKMLDSTNVTEHEAELYCKNCHARKYGPKGYGFGGGAGCLSMDTGSHLQGSNCSRIAGGIPHGMISLSQEPRFWQRSLPRLPKVKVAPDVVALCIAAEQMLARGRAFHKSCFKCGDCSKGLDSVNVTEGPDKEIYCKDSVQKDTVTVRGGGTLQSECFAVGDQAPKTTVIDTSIIKAKPGQGCPRCGGVVFAAEEVLAKGRQWHRKCFKCKDCTKTLDSINACDGPDSDVYCKTCYGKKWGPHGYGFACGSGFLQTDGLTMRFHQIDLSTTLIRPRLRPLPDKVAQDVEEWSLLPNNSWLKDLCGTRSASTVPSAIVPSNSVLACDGPGQGGAPPRLLRQTLRPQRIRFCHRPTLTCLEGTAAAFHDPRPNSGVKAAPGLGCRRCGYAVYAAEQMISKNGI
ncbi:hypothetical protein NQ317_003392 [Molorchus minor]|uniref:LIM zinc-binding domain-containing protein n=1 Tax=Molorchus minor TaxID=1323400 RepID=A0ABQ9K7S4_9CUCU|nr:hypothetical protein NQ317_003392 [Molorchus minor]